MLQLLDDFLWVLRREGFAISVPQVVDAMRAAKMVGFDDPGVLGEALACVIAESRHERVRLLALFHTFFLRAEPRSANSGSAPHGLRVSTSVASGATRRPAGEGASPIACMSQCHSALEQWGFRPFEIEILQALFSELEDDQAIDALRRVVSGGTAMASHLAVVRSRMREMTGLDPLRAGFRSMAISNAIGIGRARSALDVVAERLEEAVGIDRSRWLTDVLRNEIDAIEETVRAWSETGAHAAPETHGDDSDDRAVALNTPFVTLTPEQSDSVRSAVRVFAERLRGAARVRLRHRRRAGRLDVPKTFRSELRTGCRPFRPVHRRKSRARPKLVILCDVSDSVKAVTGFMLEFVHALAELFEHTRSFVFVSEVREVTSLFENRSMPEAIARATTAVDARDNTSHGRAFAAFESQYARAVDRDTTVVILGDARTNYRPTGENALQQIRHRAKRVLWLCTEPTWSWGLGDSAISEFASRVDAVLPAACAADLERAAYHLLSGAGARVRPRQSAGP